MADRRQRARIVGIDLEPHQAVRLDRPRDLEIAFVRISSAGLVQVKGFGSALSHEPEPGRSDSVRDLEDQARAALKLLDRLAIGADQK
jgi:hypothetical protein